MTVEARKLKKHRLNISYPIGTNATNTHKPKCRWKKGKKTKPFPFFIFSGVLHKLSLPQTKERTALCKMMVSMVFPTECIHFSRVQCQLSQATRLLLEKDCPAPSLRRPAASSHSLGLGLCSYSLPPFPEPGQILAGPSCKPAPPCQCGNHWTLWWFKCAIDAFTEHSAPTSC